MTTRDTSDTAAANLPAPWRVVEGRLLGEFARPSFTDAGAATARVAVLADARDHHPEVLLAYPGVLTITLYSHDVDAITDRDFALAGEISAILGAGPTITA